MKCLIALVPPTVLNTCAPVSSSAEDHGAHVKSRTDDPHRPPAGDAHNPVLHHDNTYLLAVPSLFIRRSAALPRTIIQRVVRLVGILIPLVGTVFLLLGLFVTFVDWLL